MDPDANLKAQRELVSLLLGDVITDDDSAIHTAVSLAELVRALDEWLVNGGAVPKEWKRS